MLLQLLIRPKLAINFWAALKFTRDLGATGLPMTFALLVLEGGGADFAGELSAVQRLHHEAIYLLSEPSLTSAMTHRPS